MRRLGRRLPGDVVVRRARRRPETVRVALRRPRRFRPRTWMVPGAFAALIAIGAALLALPIASASGGRLAAHDALFTATSAICVTGLVRFDTADAFSPFGEAVVAVLIQLGGLGVTMYAGMLILLVGGQFGLRGREFFGIELMGVTERDVRRLLRRAALYALAVEASTFVLLLPWSLTRWDPVPAVWRSLFHAVSAFNNAGFDLMGSGTGFRGQAGETYPIVVLGVSALLGSLSFITVFDMRRRPRRWTLDTRLVALGMGALQLIAMLLFAGFEVQRGRALDGLGPVAVAVNAFFLAVNRTTGMTTVEIASLQDATAALLLPLMFIGGASTSTASGIRIGAFMVSVAVVISTLRGRYRAEAFGYEIPQAIVLRATAVTLLGLLSLALGVWLMALVEDAPFLPLLFETMSGLANVGWSMGLTAGLSAPGALLLSALMFTGRLGPLIVAVSIPDRPHERYRYPYGRVRIG